MINCLMRSISAGSVIDRNNLRWRSIRLSISTHDGHMLNARLFYMYDCRTML
jgi:hypothetical protein